MCLPHTRGDEPLGVSSQTVKRCSLPHTRGDEPGGRLAMVHPQESLPHTRGDEPSMPSRRRTRAPVCPTRVGMNRSVTPPTRQAQKSLPHIRGDEPDAISLTGV